MVELYNSKKTRSKLVHEYELTPSALYAWIKKFNNTGSFHIEDKYSDEEKELIRLRKENQRQKKENDILKQAAQIKGRKINIIIANADKYPVSAMCQLLDIPRSSLYYHLKNDSQKKKHDDSDLTELIKEIFKNSRNNYVQEKSR